MAYFLIKWTPETCSPDNFGLETYENLSGLAFSAHKG